MVKYQFACFGVVGYSSSVGAEREWKDEIFIKQKRGTRDLLLKYLHDEWKGSLHYLKLRTSRILVVRFFAYIIPKM